MSITTHKESVHGTEYLVACDGCDCDHVQSIEVSGGGTRGYWSLLQELYAKDYLIGGQRINGAQYCPTCSAKLMETNSD